MITDGRNMARSAKPGSDWTADELTAYNIQVSRQDAPHFFSRELGPIEHLDPNLLLPVEAAVTTYSCTDTYHFLSHLELASRGKAGEDIGGTDNFVRHALLSTGFEERGMSLRPYRNIPFIICGETKVATPDDCLLHVPLMMILLVAQDDTPNSAPEAQVIASAIAAFRYNNIKRGDRNLQPLESITIPCVTMVGIRPSFYRVPVTRELSEAVMTGQYPEQPTIVTYCTPSTPSRCQSVDGMEIPEYRRVALQYFDAFRGFAKECWSEFIVGV